jgi:hypothetical protein
MTRAVDRTKELRECVDRLGPAASPRKPRHPPDAFVQSASAVLASVNRLHDFLLKVRKAYLSTAAVSAQRRPEQQAGLEFWEGVKSLTDAERDEIDFMVKINLKKMLESIRALELANQSTAALRVESVSYTSRQI